VTGTPFEFARTLRVAVASGKGGTGKTLVATGLAAMAARAGNSVALVDCDVEAPNDHLFLPWASPTAEPIFVPVAQADRESCTGCGLCREVCAFGAPRVLGGTAVVFDELCHGCGLCSRVCPEAAIRDVPQRVGEVTSGLAEGFDRLLLVSGRLDVGQVKTPPIIREARARGEGAHAQLVVFDAPPGVACSAVQAIRGADVLLLVTEPTPFGIHDLGLAIQLGSGLGLTMGIIVNRDTGHGDAGISHMADERGVPILARLPFQRRIAEVYADGRNAALSVPEVGDALHGVLTALPAMAGEEEFDHVRGWV